MPSLRLGTRATRTLAGTAALAVIGAGSAYAALSDADGANRHTTGDQTSEIASEVKYGKAKNVILFIGDGMGDSEITAARNYLVGAAGKLPGIDALPLTGQYTTYALHKGDDPLTAADDTGKPDYVTDSAASGSGWSTGVKTYNGAISVSLNGTTPNQTLLEWAKTQGLKTGDVTTAEIQDATPAVEVAHVADRGCYFPGADASSSTKDMDNCPAQRKDAAHPNNPGSITEQIITARPDVTLGGGMTSGFNKMPEVDSPDTVGFDDTTHTLWARAKQLGFNALGDGSAPSTKSQLDAVTSLADGPVLGLFANGNMQTRYQATPATADGYSKPAVRCTTNTAPTTWPGTQPTLQQMTSKAISLLDNNKGFFLQVEGASIDKQDHAANACGQIGETQDLDEAVKAALDFAKADGHTLVVVTADHGHTSQIINPEDITTGNSIPLAGTFNLLTADDTVMTMAWGTAQLAGSQQHTGTQVRIAGYGPGAANVVGLSDQTDLFHTIKTALGGGALDSAPTTPPAPAATVTVTAAPTMGPNSPVCLNAQWNVKLLKAQHAKKKKVKAAQAKAVLACK